MDVFVSRKDRYREGTPYRIAFVRYKYYADALKAIDRMNGWKWGDQRVVVMLARYRRKEEAMRRRQGLQENKVIQKWVKVKKKGESANQECVKPIDLRKVMNLLIDEWIEVKYVGPYRCLATFSSEEIRDGAMNNELLLSVFDEVRPH
ncbi:hypothetical protein PIB30_059547 [Stylosanthes scabra]|uniref:RRM domain-containing protein n=1 Tax=Stylosanthes scabra TaxID=79078 RepID=A0ABU6VIQ4_9FABA|nr:hypothetical protein [Stylosanthes scabra]